MASEATISRMMARIKDQSAAFDYAFALHAPHAALPGLGRGRGEESCCPGDGQGPTDIDIDASLVRVHSDKEHAAGIYKRGYGFEPMIALVDYGKANGTREILAVQLRPGNKGATQQRITS